MKDCEGTTMILDVAEVEQIVDKLERGEEVGSLFFWVPFSPLVPLFGSEFASLFVVCEKIVDYLEKRASFVPLLFGFGFLVLGLYSFFVKWKSLIICTGGPAWSQRNRRRGGGGAEKT